MLSSGQFAGLIEAIRVRYARSARMANDLMSRLETITNEQSHWHEVLSNPEVMARARLELHEIGQLRPRIERSARTWADKARAMELIVAACLGEAARATRPDPRPVLAPSSWGDRVPFVQETEEAGHL